MSDVFVNVKDFGVKGDGKTDDTIGILAAIEYAQTVNGINSVWRKSVIYFPNGTYIVSKTIVFRWYMTVQGENEKLTTIKAKDNAKLQYVFDTRGSMNSSIEAIRIDGNSDKNGAINGVLLQGTEAYKSITFSIKYLSVDNLVETGIILKSPCFGVNSYKVSVYNCGKYGIYDESTDNKFYLLSAWNCKLAGLYVGGANNHYIGGKFSFCGTKDDDNSANVVITNTRNTYSNIDSQDGYSHGVIIMNAFDNIIKGVLSDCNGNREATSESCGFKLINSRNNIIDIASTNGFHGLYPHSQRYGLKLDSRSYNNVINYVHSNQAVPLVLENYHNTINGVKLIEKITEEHKYGNKGTLKNLFIDSAVTANNNWKGGFRKLNISENKAVFSTNGAHARVSQVLTPELNKTYFFKCLVKSDSCDFIRLGIESFNSRESKRLSRVDGYEEMYSVVNIASVPDSPKNFGLYITKSEVTGEVSDMTCYELTEDLSKLTLDELIEVFDYNGYEPKNNNNMSLGNGYKLSKLYGNLLN